MADATRPEHAQSYHGEPSAAPGDGVFPFPAEWRGTARGRSSGNHAAKPQEKGPSPKAFSRQGSDPRAVCVFQTKEKELAQ